MVQKQQIVVRAVYKTEQDAEAAAEALISGFGIFAQVVPPGSNHPRDSSDDVFRIVFTDTNTNLARTMLRQIKTKPVLAQYFDPNADWQNGFVTLNVT